MGTLVRIEESMLVQEKQWEISVQWKVENFNNNLVGELIKISLGMETYQSQGMHHCWVFLL